MHLLLNKHRSLPIQLRFEDGSTVILNSGKRMEIADITKIKNLDSIRPMIQYMFIDTPKEEKTQDYQYTSGEATKTSRKKRGGN